MTTYEPTEQDQIEGLNYTIRVQKRPTTKDWVARWDNAGTVEGIWHGRGESPQEAMMNLIYRSPLPAHDQA
jgi:hypothetical protein